jgi:RNA polymerase sigma-70 factor, ECF subfamily
MSAPPEVDTLLIGRIREGDAEAWSELIGRFEGRLLAYVESRARNRTAAEDIVQETFIGFLTSLPNFDGRRPLEGYLFSIAAHKLTDHLRREGRRPTLPMISPRGRTNDWEPIGAARPASSIARSGERRQLEEAALVTAIGRQIEHFRRQGQWERLECAELMFVCGRSNKEVAAKLGIAEQTAANYKFEFLAKLRTAVRSQDLPKDVFPELYQ